MNQNRSISDRTQANRELRKKEKEERKSNLGLKNRLLSIIHDHRYLIKLKNEIFSKYKIPLIPNERCGLWYMKPSEYMTTTYFKSTDGHNHEWDFSSRRLNFHLLPLLEQNDSLGIVDSARSGKRIPDSLSKTIPIWCVILNKASFPDRAWNDLLVLPPDISPLERSEILAKLPFLFQKFQSLMLKPIILKRPLRPVWIYPGCPLKSEDLKELLDSDREFQPLLLITVSIECKDGSLKYSHFTYIQGAADDHELWAHGFDYRMLWANVHLFTDETISQDEVSRICQMLVESKRKKDSCNAISAQEDAFWNVNNTTEMTKHLYVSSILKLPLTLSTRWKNDQFNLIMIFEEEITLVEMDKAESHDFGNHMKVYPLTSRTKIASRKLRTLLPDIVRSVETVLYNQSNPKILLVCRTGDDISIGVLLACIVSFYNEAWHLNPQNTERKIDKKLVHKQLARIVEKRRVQPSRATLNSVNYYLMSLTPHH